MSWKSLGAIPPEELIEARLEMHHGVQPVAIGVARSLVEHREDDSHTALTWRAEARQWVSEELPGSGLRAGVRPEDLTLTLAGRECSLYGKTREEGLDWLRRGLVEAGHDGGEVEFDFHYEMPEHPVEEGARFDPSLRPGHAELARYYGNAELLLRDVLATAPEEAEILTWPHHFDIAILLELGENREGESRSIGIGLSPGDRYYDQPYLSVSPYPQPEGEELPPLPHGFWRRGKFFGAVLIAEEWLEGEAEGQRRRAARFLAAAVAAGRALLAEPGAGGQGEV